MSDYQLFRSYNEKFQLIIDRETGTLTLTGYSGDIGTVTWTFPGTKRNPLATTLVVLTINDSGITAKAGNITLVRIATNLSTPGAIASSYRRLDLSDDGVLRVVDIDGIVLWNN